MTDLDIRINDLIKEGEDFNYSNFSSKSVSGYPEIIKNEYFTWITKVEDFIVTNFGKGSVIYESFKKHERFKLKGNGQDQFGNAQQIILGSLHAALSTMKYKTSDDSINDIANNKVFIVHGHDVQLKHELEIFIAEIGLKPVVLHREADEGLTIIEKFEKHSDVGFAFVLLTPDDIVCSIDNVETKEYRARQNVIFEYGYFLAKLGRNRVCCLFKKGVCLPSDVNGLIYKEIENNVEEKAFSILKDLKAVGYHVDI